MTELVQHAAPRGRPHLGPRTVLTAALWCELEQAVDHARGNFDRSPFLADLLAWHVERPDLVRHHQLVISFERCPFTEREGFTGTKHCTVRVHPAVAIELIARANAVGSPRAVYNANALADLLGVPRLRTSTIEKEWPLAM
jgi:hypothetical protein